MLALLPTRSPLTPIPSHYTRIYHPARNEVSTVQNVLVRTMMRPPSQQQQQPIGASGKNPDDNSSMSSDDFSVSTSSSSAASDMEMADSNGPTIPTGQGTQELPPGEEDQDRAYWIQRTLREAIYGRVLFATVLRRRYTQQHYPHANNINADWEVTSEFCAVKEMSRQLIRKERDRLAEDPIKEVSAMQYLKRWHESKHSTSHPSHHQKRPSWKLT